MPSIVIPSNRPCEIDAPARFASTILRPARFTSLTFQPDKLAFSNVAPDMLTFLNEQPARFTLPTVAPDMFTSSKVEPEMSDLCTSRHSLTPCSFMLVSPYDHRSSRAIRLDVSHLRPPIFCTSA